ncbi:hypothetical protein M404DRAFT_148829, partial [Pisolithus tinctorius Marx 270]
VTFADDSQVVGGYANGEIRRWKILGRQQQGPIMYASGLVESVVVSQDGRWMVSGDRGNKAIVWNAVTHEKVREFAEHGGWAHGVDLSSDCTQIVSADLRNAQIFSITSGIRLPPLPHEGVVIGKAPLAWSSDGQQLFVAPRGKIICFDLSECSSSEWLIHENQSPAHIASNGRFIACAAGPSVLLWDCVSHKQICSVITHTEEVKCVALSPSGGYLACGNGRNITVYNLRGVLSPEYFDHGVSLLAIHEAHIANNHFAA